ncbi:transposase [Streptomyces tibetensis]|uniref:transposase n=1 Tax=Streptomyces tibetensis TaxID=2382123 RepID=UPI0033C8D0EE
MARLVEGHAPQLLEEGGRSDTTVTLLITVGDNPEWWDSESSFAALRGVSPVERSSGRRQVRRRHAAREVFHLVPCFAGRLGFPVPARFGHGRPRESGSRPRRSPAPPHRFGRSVAAGGWPIRRQ